MEYIALDIECTGFAENDHIIEFAGVRFDDKGNILEKKDFLIQSPKKIPEIITNLTGITNEEMQQAFPIDHYLAEIQEFITRDNAPIIGHNIIFDIDFLRRYGIHIINPMIDTFPLAHIFLPGHESYALEGLTQDLDIIHTSAHRALDDTLANMKLFIHILEKMKEQDTSSQQFFSYLFKRYNYPLQNIFFCEEPFQVQQICKERLANPLEIITHEEKQNTVTNARKQQELDTSLHLSKHITEHQNTHLLIDISLTISLHQEIENILALSTDNHENNRYLVIMPTIYHINNYLNKHPEYNKHAAIIDMPYKYFSLEDKFPLFKKCFKILKK